LTKRVVVTGGAGFVGSNLCLHLKKVHADYQVVAFDSLKRRGSELNLDRLKFGGVDFVHGDIRCREDFDALGASDVVVDASAEPSVLVGLESGADYLVNTNLNGTVHCLNYAKKHHADFIFLSTSRVYPIQGLNRLDLKETDTRFELLAEQSQEGVTEKGISESFALKGTRSLYGATKLAAELLIEEYREWMGIRTIVNRFGVVAGPWQMGKVDQGFVALWMAKHFWQKELAYIGYGGSGKQVRDLLHVQDLVELIDRQIQEMDRLSGQTFNVGGGIKNTASLLEMTGYCQELTGNAIPIKKVAETRTADVPMYCTDNSLIGEVMNWQPRFGLDSIAQDTYGWMKENQSILKPILA